MLQKTRNKPTLRDVAKLAGCSTAVVSTVVNNARGNTLASASMQQRVMEAARKLGYRPNFASRSLVRRLAQTIGIYVPPDPWAGLGMRYEGAIVQGIEQACRAHGYDVLAINLSGAGDPGACAEKFAEQRIDGLVLLHVAHNSTWIEPLLRQSPNVVAVNYYGQAPVDRVNFDDRLAAAMAVGHLADLGHRRIAYMGSRREWSGPGADLRCAGYREAMAERDLPVDPQWVWDWSNSALRPEEATVDVPDDSAAGALHMWRSGRERPTAVVAYSDLVAARAMQRLQQTGCRLPQDMSIMGIDGTDIGELIWPPLSSVVQPFAKMGLKATELVIRHALAGEAEGMRVPTTELMASELVVRGSTVAPAAAG